MKIRKVGGKMPYYSTKIFVSTRARHRQGSSFGSWLDLRSYDNQAEFLNACFDIHWEEADNPEYRFCGEFADHSSLGNETEIKPVVWDILEFEEPQQRILFTYASNFSLQGRSLFEILNSYFGRYDSDADFAQDYFMERFPVLEKVANEIGVSIDWNDTWKSTLSKAIVRIETPLGFWYFSNKPEDSSDEPRIAR